MVQRSPFLTQSAAVRRSRLSLAAGDDHVSDTGQVPVGQRHPGSQAVIRDDARGHGRSVRRPRAGWGRS